jgi:hypothetical protein
VHVKFDFALRKIISGGQTGADQAGLVAATLFHLETGGFAPDNFMTVHGSFLPLKTVYGLIEGGSYPVRTEKNVRLADATIRFASNLKSPGELCTLRAINKHRKPYLDVQFPAKETTVTEVVDFIERHAVQVLNVAGNADRKDPVFGEHFTQTFDILAEALERLDRQGRLAKKE